ncbi:hypothetical protein PBY51_013845 [Eleginops maclovinus]|uniref:Uncharacterized protein n=1 Tax=Eleginops maclovinus TaxID=56733 RepID=A0AAN7Y8I9_ELEMC|nr:hypothetical protein PBY51_013845 [Eleginops maclovinus]
MLNRSETRTTVTAHILFNWQRGRRLRLRDSRGWSRTTATQHMWTETQEDVQVSAADMTSVLYLEQSRLLKRDSPPPPRYHSEDPASDRM